MLMVFLAVKWRDHLQLHTYS